MSERYRVRISPYTKKHYFKDLKKKYSTRVQRNVNEAVEKIIQNPKTSIEKAVIETITHQNNIIIGKFDIAIPSQNISARKGWRAIVAIHEETKTSQLLLIYSKDHVKGSHETEWWKSEIKSQYPELEYLL